MIVVSDTTPISELAKINCLDLLHALFIRVIIPQAVYTELTVGDHPAAAIVPTLDWIDICAVSNSQHVKQLQRETNLHVGEAAAIVLAEELRADQLLIDEKAARRVAAARQLPMIGTVGILLLAKQRGHIVSVKTILDAMLANGTRISERLYDQALTLAEEKLL